MTPTVLGMTEVVAHQVFACHLLGTGSGYQLYILVVSLYPFIMPSWKAWIKVGLFLFTLAGFLYIQMAISAGTPLVTLDPVLLRWLMITNIIFSFVCLGIWGTYFNLAVDRTEAELDGAYSKVENLLLNVLPAPIAERLKEKERVISDRFSDASILFADLVGFTRFSERMPPDELVAILNTYFTAFDDLAEKHGLEKIKTIGDAYMVAAGVPQPDPGHAHRMCAFALEMLAVLQRCNVELGHALELRIGTHCGPVAAGVIGTHKFAYDLWGDTVNTASRMESHGVGGKVHVTEELYQACRNAYSFEERGVIEVKGKGPMRTYFLRGSGPA
ncbi:MAG: adenylate/guanylate cyclase domain-containing protein [Flavobacteriales bacterium]|nr:adenylate/guanylate cyclase domain-containing protein [Flavobacteriales bacterium]MCB9193207.1 adenylate/guanylate cyclase domain-containing protein [Flavobacteriales bacterium]